MFAIHGTPLGFFVPGFQNRIRELSYGASTTTGIQAQLRSKLLTSKPNLDFLGMADTCERSPGMIQLVDALFVPYLNISLLADTFHTLVLWKFG